MTELACVCHLTISSACGDSKHLPVRSNMTGCCSTGAAQKPAAVMRHSANSCSGTAMCSGGRQPSSAQDRKALLVDSHNEYVSTRPPK